MAKMTEGEKCILEKLGRLAEPIKSEDLADLQPRTTREHLMVMLPTQHRILEHLEGINDFNSKISTRVSWLEAAWKVGGAVITASLLALAVNAIFG